MYDTATMKKKITESCENCRHSRNIDDMPQYLKKNNIEFLFCEEQKRLIKMECFTVVCKKWEAQ